MISGQPECENFFDYFQHRSTLQSGDYMVFSTVLKNLISISCFQEFSQQTIKTIVFLFLRLAFTLPPGFND